jgi:hypothetical protein
MKPETSSGFFFELAIWEELLTLLSARQAVWRTDTVSTSE